MEKNAIFVFKIVKGVLALGAYVRTAISCSLKIPQATSTIRC